MGYTHGKRRREVYATPSHVGLTTDELKSLAWFAERGQSAGLDVTTVPGGLRVFPTAHTRDYLLKIGMLERHAPTGIYVYEVSEAGRAALAAASV
jgi:hypothetical protein